MSASRRVMTPVATRRQRMTPETRRRQILQAAVSYFAEVGFDGGTRELARRLGVTQPLIYRYFPSKEDLIRAVYEDVYLRQWRPEWEVQLAAADEPIRDRLIAFYRNYTAAIFRPEWLRIYLFAGLRGIEINRWWISFVEHHVLRHIAEAVRAASHLPSTGSQPIGPEELELYWMFHGGIFYYGMRREVYHRNPAVPLDQFIASSVDALLAGLPAVLARLLSHGV